eukprot:g37961.t1
MMICVNSLTHEKLIELGKAEYDAGEDLGCGALGVLEFVLETEYPEALFFIAGDFNQANLKTVLPRYHQHISCPTTGLNILDHCCTTVKDAYHSIPYPHFGKSDHNTVLFLLIYKQKLEHEDPVQKVVQCWSEAAEGLLQDCFEPQSFDNTTIVDWISNNYGTAHRKEIEYLVTLCKENNLSINVKTKELVIDFGKQSEGHYPVCTSGAEMEIVESVKFLGVAITNHLSWSTYIDVT